MKTVIIGGGKGCKGIIELASGAFLTELTLDIQCVVDPDSNAPGIDLAGKLNIKTSANMADALTLPGIELVIELTGQDKILERLYKILPAGVRLIDHTFARIFWDLVNASEDKERRLREIIDLEEKIEQERHFLQSSFDTIPDLVIVVDPQQKIIKINDSMSRFTHIPVSKAPGRTIEEFFTNTELAGGSGQTNPLLDEVLETGRQRSLIWHTNDPEEVFWEIIFAPILNQDLEIDAIVGTWHRITEQVRLHREIESAEIRFRSFIDSAHDWISIKDLEGRYILVNPVCAQAFGRQPEDFIGHRPDEILPLDFAKMVVMHDRQVIESNSHHTYDEVFNIDNNERHYHTVRFPLADYRGNITGVCTISRDVTQERELNDQLAQAVKLAAVGKLAAGVAHEINNPLTGILAYAEDMKEEIDSDSPYQDDIKVIIRETKRCRDIVRNLLDFARQEKPKLEPLYINKIISRALVLVHKLPSFRNIKIEQNLEKELHKIDCDRHQLQQVILNLMINASDAMKEHGQIVLSTEYDKPHHHCIISVADNGPGIPKDLKDKIFEPFFSTKGTNGLGLAVSWGIIERHNGYIETDTSESGGAIFRIVLPTAENDGKNQSNGIFQE